MKLIVNVPHLTPLIRDGELLSACIIWYDDCGIQRVVGPVFTRDEARRKLHELWEIEVITREERRVVRDQIDSSELPETLMSPGAPSQIISAPPHAQRMGVSSPSN